MKALRFGERTTVRAHGFVFDVAMVGGNHYSTRATTAAYAVHASGPLVLSFQGKYLARLHWRDIRRWAKHFALQMLVSKPWMPHATVAYYVITREWDGETRWWGGKGWTTFESQRTHFTQVNADRWLKRNDKLVGLVRCVPVYTPSAPGRPVHRPAPQNAL